MTNAEMVRGFVEVGAMCDSSVECMREMQGDLSVQIRFAV